MDILQTSPLNRPATLSARPEQTQSVDKKAAVEFEAYMLGAMLEDMYRGVDTSGLTGGGHAEEVWRSFLLQEYGKELAAGGGVGIAENIMRMRNAYQTRSGE